MPFGTGPGPDPANQFVGAGLLGIPIGTGTSGNTMGCNGAPYPLPTPSLVKPVGTATAFGVDEYS
jgi:hypothetical protein